MGTEEAIHPRIKVENLSGNRRGTFFNVLRFFFFRSAPGSAGLFRKTEHYDDFGGVAYHGSKNAHVRVP